MLFVMFFLISVALAVVSGMLWGFAIWQAILLGLGCCIVLNVFWFLVGAVASFTVDKTKPLVKQNAICRSSCIYVSNLLSFYGGIRYHITGMEKVPTDQSFLMVCNHRAALDPLVVISKFNKFNVSFISKPSNITIPVIGAMAYGAGTLPIDRENDREALKCILTAADYLKRGVCSLVIYPEGTRSKTEQLLPFHAGSFKIAQRANAPLVICSIRGVENLKKNFFRRRTDVYFDILEVMPAEQVKATGTKELAEHSVKLISENLGI
jgi:1-acyl-sn-glycerol-3-phosphate acyltransferase